MIRYRIEVEYVSAAALAEPAGHLIARRIRTPARKRFWQRKMVMRAQSTRPGCAGRMGWPQ
ncbi:hypothetical protein HH310_00120 [Actinoplanes sp. TBRC 11911]|uniref:hypothetical protein n=1 Tax=Actinoplanes sp. TBRC 11911 TaxID=2729386 RepID=UPI00145DEE34|nr:hypothetical protein [Actinoplanes sp. TBRC 11911]NMO49610.1 hypothetical protein [Actinoplanes sp. TBRC 11911]